MCLISPILSNADQSQDGVIALSPQSLAEIKWDTLEVQSMLDSCNKQVGTRNVRNQLFRSSPQVTKTLHEMTQECQLACAPNGQSRCGSQSAGAMSELYSVCKQREVSCSAILALSVNLNQFPKGYDRASCTCKDMCMRQNNTAFTLDDFARLSKKCGIGAADFLPDTVGTFAHLASAMAGAAWQAGARQIQYIGEDASLQASRNIDEARGKLQEVINAENTCEAQKAVPFDLSNGQERDRKIYSMCIQKMNPFLAEFASHGEQQLSHDVCEFLAPTAAVEAISAGAKGLRFMLAAQAASPVDPLAALTADYVDNVSTMAGAAEKLDPERAPNGALLPKVIKKAPTTLEDAHAPRKGIGRKTAASLSEGSNGVRGEPPKTPGLGRALQVTQETLTQVVQAKKAPLLSFVKDVPSLAYRITSKSWKDIPIEIRQRLGWMDQTKYPENFLEDKVGSVIMLQMNGDQPDFYILAKEVFDQKYRVVERGAVVAKNSKYLTRVTPHLGLGTATTDAKLIAVQNMSTTPMTRMSDLGYPVDQEVTIESAWGAQTKPAGQDAFIVHDTTNGKYYMVNVDTSTGLPASYVPATH